MKHIFSFLLTCLLPVALLGQAVDSARAELRKGNAKEAKTILEDALKKDGKNAEAHYALGLIFLRRDMLDADAAEDEMDEAIELNPNNADYYFGLGAALGTKAQNTNPLKQAWLAPKVKSAFENAVALNPKHLQAHLGLADFYQMAPGIMGGSNTKAWQEADIALSLDEYQGRAKRAQMFLRDKKVSEAEGEWKTLTTNLPNEWRAWKRLGYFYISNGRADESIAPFQRFVQLRPDTADSYDSLAEGFLAKKDYDTAIANAKKALELDQKFVNALYTLAGAHEQKGQKLDAREYYQQALALDTNVDRRKNTEKTLARLQQ
jgi:Tfp pilus assembly protein PilF